MTTTRRTSIIALVALATLALSSAACSFLLTPAAGGPLLTVETRGGLCADGPCGMTVYVERGGRVHQAAKPPNDLGFVEPGALTVLEATIRTTDFAAIQSRPFAGTCPTAFDGQEIVYQFATPSGVERIATCEVEVDFGAPLFVAVSTALGPFIPLPTT